MPDEVPQRSQPDDAQEDGTLKVCFLELKLLYLTDLLCSLESNKMNDQASLAITPILQI